MKNIFDKNQFIVNQKGDKVGVLIDVKTFNKIEDFYEDFVLGKKMERAKKTKSHSLKTAAKKLKYEL